MIRRSYKFRVSLSAEQVRQAEKFFFAARFVWNFSLEMRTKAYRRRGESLSGFDVSRALTRLKATPRFSWLKESSAVMLNQKIRDQDLAFENFFSGSSFFPRFKSRRQTSQSIRFQMDQRTIHTYFRAGEYLRLPKLGELKVRWSRVPGGVPKMVTLSRDAAGDFYVSFVVDEIIQKHAPTNKSVGLDRGLKDIVVTSDGFKSGNPKHYRSSLRQLKRAQRVLDRRQKGSGRWLRAKKRLATLHQKVSNQRKDFLHKLSTRLVIENQVIALEDLSVSGMMKNHHLALSVMDSGLGNFQWMLEYKSQWHDRKTLYVDTFERTSGVCPEIGYVTPQRLSLKVRYWSCPCGKTHDRDIAAAQVILLKAAGGNSACESLDSKARGETLRPVECFA